MLSFDVISEGSGILKEILSDAHAAQAVLLGLEARRFWKFWFKLEDSVPDIGMSGMREVSGTGTCYSKHLRRAAHWIT